MLPMKFRVMIWSLRNNLWMSLISKESLCLTVVTHMNLGAQVKSTLQGLVLAVKHKLIFWDNSNKKRTFKEILRSNLELGPKEKENSSIV